MDRDSLKLLLAQGLSLEEIGRRYGKHPSTVGYWVKRHGLIAVHHDRHAFKGGIERDTLEGLIEEGLSIDRIAQRLGMGHTTVRYWLDKYGLETPRMTRARLNREAIANGEDEVRLVCGRHGWTEFRKLGDGRYRCRRCSSEFVSRRRRKVKEILVAEAGGECAVCGYKRYAGALQFHHLDPADKCFEMGSTGITRSLESARTEAAKCVLLCANCHSEVEAGLVSVEAGSNT